MIKQGLAIGAAIIFMSGCVVSIDGEDDPDFSTHFSIGQGDLGAVYGADFSGDALTVTVSDNGCTTKDFFTANVHREDDNEFEVGLERIRRDYCKVNNPDGVALTWTYAELGLPDGAEVTLLNRVRR